MLPTDAVVWVRTTEPTTTEVFSPYLAVPGIPVAVSVTAEVKVTKTPVVLYEVRKEPLKRNSDVKGLTRQRQRQS